jgi:hypothetical protein
MKPYSLKHKVANKIVNVPKTHSRNKTRRQFIRYFKKSYRQYLKNQIKLLVQECTQN